MERDKDDLKSSVSDKDFTGIKTFGFVLIGMGSFFKNDMLPARIYKKNEEMISGLFVLS